MHPTEVAGPVLGQPKNPSTIKLLFVEDDIDFREALADELSDHGFAVQCFGDLGPFWPQYAVLLALALAVAGKLATETGALP